VTLTHPPFSIFLESGGLEICYFKTAARLLYVLFGAKIVSHHNNGFLLSRIGQISFYIFLIALLYIK
jgi:hypothetical protein